MALIRIEGGDTLRQSLRQQAAQSGRHDTILFAVPHEDFLERNPFDLEASRLEVSQCFPQICFLALPETFRQRLGTIGSNLMNRQDSLIWLSKPR